MPFCYSYAHKDGEGGDACPESFDEIRTMETRNNPAKCPVCGGVCRKIMTAVNFNMVFPGSERAERQAEEATRESIRLQDEGFTSKDEIQAAEGQAAERAKELGIPKERILGGMPSALTGDKFTPSKDDALTQQKLVEARVKAMQKGDQAGHKRAVHEMAEHEQGLQKKAAAIKREFKPLRDKKACQKDIVAAQRSRKMSV